MIGVVNMSWIRGKDLLINISLILVGLFLAVVLTEIFLRIILPLVEVKQFDVKNSEIFVTDPVLGFKIKANSGFGHDQWGFKNPVQADYYPIVALGDSHTYGEVIGQNKNNEDVSWPAYLSEYLNKAVYNMGVAGYGTAQYYALTDKIISKKPKLVVLGFYIGNDIYDTYDIVYTYDFWNKFRDPNFIDKQHISTSNLGQSQTLFSQLKRFVWKKSVFYKFLVDRTRIWREKIGLTSPYFTGTNNWLHPPAGASLRFDKGEISTLFWNDHRLPGVDISRRENKEGMRLTKLFLGQMAEIFADYGINFIVAIFPTKQNVYYDIIGYKAYNNNTFRRIVENDELIKSEINLICDKYKNVFCLDVLPFMKKRLLQGMPVYYQNINDHPNSEGYKVYAKSIADFIKENNLLNDNKYELD